jgi:GT2 family glycosyltransferase
LDLSIIILTWNTREFLIRCLDSINEFKDSLKFEIIIIDNGSTDNTLSIIKEKYPNCITIRNEKNLGTSERNKGIEVAKGKFIAFIDSDIELLDYNTFGQLIDYLDKNNNVGIVSPMLILNSGEIQYSCKEFLSFYTPILRRLDFLKFITKTKLYRKQLLLDWDHKTIRDVDYCVSAFWVLKKEIIDLIGMFDTKIFYSPEDVDYCLRCWKTGYKVTYIPYVKVKHCYQRMTRKLFSKITFEHIKGLFYFFWKHKYLIKPIK